jgi:Ca-activated chloride channel family protein
MRFSNNPAVILFSLLCAPLLAAQPQEPAPQQSPAIRVSVDRVNVGVIVTDARGHFVEGLRREEFHIFDNGVEQPVTEFSSVADPGQVLLLIEAGPAIYFLQGSHLQAAFTLLNGLSAGDRVAIVGYADTAMPVLDFTTDKRAAAVALEQLRFNLGFLQLNLSSSLNTVLDWLAQVAGKKTVVLLSTGVDTSPSSAIAALLARLRATDVRVLAVSLGGSLRNAKTTNKSKEADAATGFAEADQQLRNLADATGGRAYFPKNTKEFNAVYAEIAQLVRHEYSLAFNPSSNDGQLHTIQVKVKRYWCRVDHRQAYVAPPPR